MTSSISRAAAAAAAAAQTSIILNVGVDHDGEQHVDAVEVAAACRQVERRGGRVGPETSQQFRRRVEQHFEGKFVADERRVVNRVVSLIVADARVGVVAQQVLYHSDDNKRTLQLLTPIASGHTRSVTSD